MLLPPVHTKHGNYGGLLMVPKNYDEIKDQMSQLLCNYDYRPDIFSPSIAYTYTVNSSTLGIINHICINNQNPELEKFLFVHEAGHVLFGHNRPKEDRINTYLESKLQGAYSRLAVYFGNDINYFFEIFTNYFLNLVMDFEVNSRLFTYQEFCYMSNMVKQFLQSDEGCDVWPEYYGLPAGKTWNEYLTIILLEPEIYFHRLRLAEMIKNYKKRKAQMFAEAGLAFDGNLSEQEYFAIQQNAMSALSKNEKESMKKIAQNHSDGKFSIPTGIMLGCSKTGGNACHIAFTKYVSMPDLVDKMKKILFVKKAGYTMRNQMYNVNRRKYSSSVIIPKTVKNTSLKKPDLYLLFDVSGSIDSKSVHDFIETFRKFKDEFKYTKIVYWTTSLVCETDLCDPLPNLYGGGTHMAKGIDYINIKYNLKEKDVFFMISDFCDNMNEWKNELEKLHCRKLAIDWTTSFNNINPGFETILKNDMDKKKAANL